MSERITVTCSELRAAANDISKANEEFRDAAAKVQVAGETLANGWQGPSQVRFASGLEKRKAWFEQMAAIVDEYVTMMNAAAEAYEEMDAQGAAIIRKK